MTKLSWGLVFGFGADVCVGCADEFVSDHGHDGIDGRVVLELHDSLPAEFSLHRMDGARDHVLFLFQLDAIGDSGLPLLVVDGAFHGLEVVVRGPDAVEALVQFDEMVIASWVFDECYMVEVVLVLEQSDAGDQVASFTLPSPTVMTASMLASSECLKPV